MEYLLLKQRPMDALGSALSSTQHFIILEVEQQIAWCHILMKKNVGAPTCVVGQKIFTCRILCLPLQIHQSELSKLHVEAMRSMMVSVRQYEASCHMGMLIEMHLEVLSRWQTGMQRNARQEDARIFTRGQTDK